jgi:phage terminase large subunit
VQGREAHVVLAGNTTSVEGALYDASVRHRGMWKLYHVTADPDDPKRTPRIDIEYARRMIEREGRDNPWVMINLLARFPNQGINQLISIEEVQSCIGRHLHRNAYEWAPRIMGGDVAAFGDDRSVAFLRQGTVYKTPHVMRQQDALQVGGHWMAKATEWQAEAIHIDATGGYGGAVIALMRQQGFSVMPVEFAGKPFDPKFYNKRAEMAWEACANLKAGASLPSDCPDLLAELTTTTYGYKGDRILLEPKESVKARLGRSPDLADALFCTHAFPVATTRQTREALFPLFGGGSTNRSKTDYDPLSRE